MDHRQIILQYLFHLTRTIFPFFCNKYRNFLSVQKYKKNNVFDEVRRNNNLNIKLYAREAPTRRTSARRLFALVTL